MIRGFHIACVCFFPVLLGACAGNVKPEDPQNGGSVHWDPSAGPEPAVEINVANFNLLRPKDRTVEMSLDLPEVRSALAASVAGTNASLIGFNELDENYLQGGSSPLEDICADLPDSWRWCLEWPNDTHLFTLPDYSYANGFAYDSSVLGLDDCGYVWMSKTEQKWYEDPLLSYLYAGATRTCVWALFTHLASGRQFAFFVTHLPTESQGGGENMAGVLNSFAASKFPELPQILVGDLNSAASGSNQAPYSRMKEYWTDAYESVSAAGRIGKYAEYCGTLSGSSDSYFYDVDTFVRNHPERRIDHILYRGGFKASSYGMSVVTYNAGDGVRCPSDHLPVYTCLALN